MSEEVDDMLDLLYQLFIEVVDKHLPIKKRRVKRQSQPEWLRNEITEAMKIRDDFARSQKIVKWKWWKIKLPN